MRNLKASGRYFLLSSGRHVAVADLTGNGRLTKQYQIIEMLTFYNSTRESCDVLICQCKNGCTQRERLLLTGRGLRMEDISKFKETEENSYCVHCKAVLHLDMKHQHEPDTTEDVLVDQLSTSPLLVGVYTDDTYGVVTKEQHNRKYRLRCLTCTSGVTGCKHVAEYYSWCKENDIHIDLTLSDHAIESDQFESVSYQKIPYPLPNHLKELYDDFETGRVHIPVDLVPTIGLDSNDVLSMTDIIPYEKLRRAWNSFARLLDIIFDEAFQCSICKDKAEVIVCDATFLGCRKDLLPTMDSANQNTANAPLKGSVHRDRVFINDKKLRDLLLKFSGIDRKTWKPGVSSATELSELSEEEFGFLLDKLKKKGHDGLSDFIDTVVGAGDPKTSPAMYKNFFFELSHNSPLCGVFQIANNRECLELIEHVLDGTIDLTDSDRRCELEVLHCHAPIMAEFLANVTKKGHLRIASRLIADIISCISRPFENSPVHSEDDYPPPTDSHFAFFPSLPKFHDDATYSANREGDCKKDEKMDCRKESYGHPTLSPGIFTIFCEHGVCYGFELMTSHESPRHPFSIFKTRFKTAAKCIIYDNACQLHKYCLNREPHFFRGTVFYVDRFHWKCHIGCSSGYCLDKYRTNFDIAGINSQINEQANAGLKKLQAQLSYMSPSNFIFHVKLFLAIKNKDKSKRAQLAEMIQDLRLA